MGYLLKEIEGINRQTEKRKDGWMYYQHFLTLIYRLLLWLVSRDLMVLSKSQSIWKYNLLLIIADWP